jgi:phosphoglycolate phosphatase
VVRLRAVLFDFDLTLVDSTLAVIECSNHALSTMGFKPAEREVLRRTIGLPLPEAFRCVTGLADTKLETEYTRRFVSRADEVMVAWTRFYEGVPEALLDMRAAGLRLAIVSTKFRYRIDAILAKAALADAIDIVVGGEDVRQHKPSPDGLLYALARLDVTPSEALYVGDHPFDAEAAARARTAFVMVRTGSYDPAEWSGQAPLAVIDDVSELPKLLTGIGAEVANQPG